MEKVAPQKLVCCFDSGIGGLKLFYECVEMRKDCNFAYFADNYNVPYGSLTGKEILRLADEKFSLIAKLNPSAAVVACNTVTAECADYLRKKYPFPIIGIQPAVKPAAAVCKNCVVLCTPATAESVALKNLVERFGKGRVRVIPCEGLAAYVETHIFNMVKEEMENFLPEADCDGVVLGCTHYSYAADIISERYNCPVFDGIKGTAARFNEIIGICDHRGSVPQKVEFLGGNALFNRKVFEFISRNSIYKNKI